MLFQFKDVNSLGVARGTQKLSVGAEGQWADANVSEEQKHTNVNIKGKCSAQHMNKFFFLSGLCMCSISYCSLLDCCDYLFIQSGQEKLALTFSSLDEIQTTFDLQERWKLWLQYPDEEKQQLRHADQ